jgi:hypothetical protein
MSGGGPDIRALLANPHVVRSLVLACLVATCMCILLWCFIGCCCSRVLPFGRRSSAAERQSSYEKPPMNGAPTDPSCRPVRTKVTLERTTLGARRVDGPALTLADKDGAYGLHPDNTSSIEPSSGQIVRIGWRVQVPPGHAAVISGAASPTFLFVSSKLLHPGWNELSVEVFNASGQAIVLSPESPPFAYLRVERLLPFVLAEAERPVRSNKAKAKRPSPKPSIQSKRASASATVRRLFLYLVNPLGLLLDRVSETLRRIKIQFTRQAASFDTTETAQAKIT